MTESVVSKELEKLITPEMVRLLIQVFKPVIEDALFSLETWHRNDKSLPKFKRCNCTDCLETRPWLQELLHKMVLWHLYCSDENAGVTLKEVVESLQPVHGTAPINTRWSLLIRNELDKRQRNKDQMELDLECLN